MKNLIHNIKKNELLYISLLLIIASLASFYLIVYSNFIKYKNIRKNNLEAKQKIDKYQAILDKINDLNQTDWSEVNQKLKIIIPPNKDYVSFFNRLEYLQGASGALVKNADMELGKVGSDISNKSNVLSLIKVQANFSLSSTEDSLIKFLESFYKLDGRIIEINNLTIKFLPTKLNDVSFKSFAYYASNLSTESVDLDSSIKSLTSNQEVIFKEIKSVPFYSSDKETIKIKIGKENLFR